MGFFIKESTKNLLKFFKVDVVYYFFKNYIFFNRVAVKAEKNLADIVPVDAQLEKAGVKLVEITSSSLRGDDNCQPLFYLDEERKEKALLYLRKGYQGLAVVSGNEVNGDIWYTSARNKPKGSIHPDLGWLKMSCGESDAYAFDMYLNPARRGKNLANLLQGGVLNQIKKDGFTRALGYYWAENIPALWVHRTLQWTETGRVKVSRFWCLSRTVEI